jgi:3-dehydroquinate synthase
MFFNFNDSSTEVLFYEDIKSIIKSIILTENNYYLIDKNVYRIYKDEFKELKNVFVLDPIESNKDINSLIKIVEFLKKKKCNKKSLLISIGGGLTCDLGGFVSSVFLRGIKSCYIPTTLTAFVDAALGGKTGINFSGIKNYLGTFNHPTKVLLTTKFLQSLNVTELKSGLVESLKMGIVLNKKLFELIALEASNIFNKNLNNNILSLIKLSIKTKMKVVEMDVKDINVRMSLNFGHSFGHALEQYYENKISHGQAVAYGIKAATYFALNIELIKQVRFDIIIKQIDLLIEKFNFENVDINLLIDKMTFDKKNNINGITIILPIEKTGYKILVTNDKNLLKESFKFALGSIR